MHEPIIVVHAGPDEGEKVCAILDRHDYSSIELHSLEELTLTIRNSPCHAVILDLDSLPVDNRFIRNLCKDNPGLCVIGTSSRMFHPELEDSMRAYISACLSKPVDEDELIYWLKSICGGKPRPRASPCDV